MTDTITPIMAKASDTDALLKEARLAHERYLIKQQDADIEKAIECYIDAIKADPIHPESYYRLASLLLINGQISLEGAIEQ